MIIPKRLIESCRVWPEREAWLARLPSLIEGLTNRWALSVSPPFDSDEVSCAWVAPATRQDGTAVVLKVGMPHMEGTHEIDGLRFWNGDPTVRLIDAEDAANAMLLERCTPGTHLRQLPEHEQDVVLAGILRRLRRSPPDASPFRPLSALTASWSDETMADEARWPDSGVVRAGLDLLRELSARTVDDVVLATDLHAGNVLRARRAPWLAIDPKPFVGDAAFDGTQHLLNCRSRLLARPTETVRRFAELAGLNYERLRLWLFARAVAGPRRDWSQGSMELAQALAPRRPR